MTDLDPRLSVVIPTFNNERILRRCLTSWQQPASVSDVEIIVIEDGCRDRTRDFLEAEGQSSWGRRHLRWIHLDDAHELRCTNAGLSAARAPLMMAWQDDMFVAAGWLVPELLATFQAHQDIGLMSLSRGLDHYPLDEPIARWEDLVDWRRLRSTIGPRPGNWFRLQEVDTVIRPWIVRRACLERVGNLDEAFVPTEWDEADLAYRIRGAGWKVATCWVRASWRLRTFRQQHARGTERRLQGSGTEERVVVSLPLVARDRSRPCEVEAHLAPPDHDPRLARYSDEGRTGADASFVVNALRC